jgi:hypothetical protein
MYAIRCKHDTVTVSSSEAVAHLELLALLLLLLVSLLQIFDQAKSRLQSRRRPTFVVDLLDAQQRILGVERDREKGKDSVRERERA